MGIYYTIAAVFLGMQLAAGENLSQANPDFSLPAKSSRKTQFYRQTCPTTSARSLRFI
jgi:uncharacterized protein (DUF2237 family)